MVILDVDGVMTDGRIIYDSNGMEYKCFNVHDGYGIARAIELGLKLAMLSGRSSKILDHRAKRLGITELHQGADDKVVVFEKIRNRHRLKNEEVCFIGDDEFDLPLLKLVGFSASPRDAIERVKNKVDYVAGKNGGKGAVREILDLILNAKNLI